MGHGTIRVTPVVGDPIVLDGVRAIVWAVLDLPRTQREVVAEALATEPLLDESEILATLSDLRSSGLVWLSAQDIAI